jgi:transposase
MIEFSQEEQYQVMHGVLNERQWRLYVATEARRRGTGGISRVAREAGVTRKTIHKGLQELEAGELYEPGDRMRRKGGGRKQVTARDETLRADLEELVEPKGDPQSLVQWTTKSMRKLKEALKSQGHTIGETAIRDLLKRMGFSLKANKKTIEGSVHADRDAQFQQINRTGKAFKAAGKPMISVDCKKKELIGNFKNSGREWQAKGQETTVKRFRMASMIWFTTAGLSMWALTMRPPSLPWKASDGGGKAWERVSIPAVMSCSSLLMEAVPMGLAADCGRYNCNSLPRRPV